MLKVLYLLNFAGKAGTERYVETLVKYLSADGLVQPFFAYNEGGLLVERLEAMGVPCRRVEMRRRFDKKAARELAKLCLLYTSCGLPGLRGGQPGQHLPAGGHLHRRRPRWCRPDQFPNTS